MPTVNVLVPLFREASIFPDLAAALARLDYPAHLLEVIILFEERDAATIAAARSTAPAHWRIVLVPPGRPQTKPGPAMSSWRWPRAILSWRSMATTGPTPGRPAFPPPRWPQAPALP